MSIYKELNDKDWLHKEYIVEKKSLVRIAKDIGCNHNSVRQAAIKYGFKIRNCSEAQIVNSTTNLNINKSVLDGSLMGDAFLTKWRKSDKSLPHLNKKNKNYDHIEWFANKFEVKPKIEFVEQYLKQTEKTYTFYTYRTCVDEKLQEYYNRWYPKWNNYVKVIPDDLVIDATFLLHWYLDDGYSHYRKREYELEQKGWTQNKEQVILGFCTECFNLEQQQKICDKINKTYNLGIKPRKIVWNNSKELKEGYRLIVPQLKTNDFFNIIGNCPIKSLEYKWKLV